MNTPNPEDKPKIIIDEDWKSQVEAEKEKLKEQEESGELPGSDDDMQLPQASLGILAQMLSAQALSALGQFPDPANDGRVVVHLEYAKLQIDLLAVLKEKTAGQATPEEAQLMEETLHQLRMLFVNVQNEVASMVAKEQQQHHPATPRNTPLCHHF